jgi:hypothetical protein
VSSWYKRIAVLGACTAGLAGLCAAPAEDVPGSDRVVAWTDERVKEWQPTAAERRFDEIGWARDIRTARRLAEKHHRPVFLFTMQGRINIGRC